MQIYLDEQITIDGIKIGHTREGLHYMIAHYEHILALPLTKQQLSDEDRAHIENNLLVNYKIHLLKYESQ